MLLMLPLSVIENARNLFRQFRLSSNEDTEIGYNEFSLDERVKY
jgi:hypothetical protein